MKRIALTIMAWLALAGVGQANIVIKAMAVNPSKDQAKTAKIRVALPQEAKPEDIVNSGDFEIQFDAKENVYYGVAEYALQPGEVVEREIEIRDLWHIPNERLEAVLGEAAKIMPLLKNSEHEQRAQQLSRAITENITLVKDRQASPPNDPQRYILSYRENKTLLDAALADLSAMRLLLAQGKILPSRMIWNVFFGVLGFLGVLVVGMLLFWLRQSRSIKAGQPAAPAPEALTPEEHNPAQGKDATLKNIEDIFKREDGK